MQRLTEKGYKFSSEQIFRFVDKWSIAQCLNRLSAYEDTELTPEEVCNLKRAQKPKAFIYPMDDQDSFKCPSCNLELFEDDYFGDLETTHYCKNCGQKLCK